MAITIKLTGYLSGSEIYVRSDFIAAWHHEGDHTVIYLSSGPQIHVRETPDHIKGKMPA